MAYSLQHSPKDQEDMLKNILTNLHSSECDLIIVTQDGKKVFMQKQVLCLFSKTIASLLRSVSYCNKDLLAISVDVSYKSVCKMCTVLSSGEAAIDKEEDLLDMVEAAELLGIDMENSEVVFKKSLKTVRSRSFRNRNRIKPDKFEGFTFIEEEDYQLIVNNITEDNSNKLFEEDFKHKYPALEEEQCPQTEFVLQEQTKQMPEIGEASENLDIKVYEDTKDTFDRLEHKHSKKEKTLKCDHCKASFSSKKNFHKHSILHSVEKPFECTDCGEKFDKISKLKVHRANKNKKYKCEECGSAFAMSDTYKKHKLTHLTEKPYPCEICPKQFTQEVNLVKHMEHYKAASDEEHRDIVIKILESKRFQCEICALMFSRPRNVKNHKERVHSDIKPFECHQCKKSYPHISGLNQHNKVHHNAFRKNKTLFVLKEG